MSMLTPAAWLMLVSTWAVIAGCTGYCFYRLLTSQRDLTGED
jgi:hypothetical protein